MKFLPTVFVLGVLAGSADAQNLPRKATIRGGGNSNEGKCTIEVVVDGAAQVTIRGDSASLSNLNGQPPQWRRFECTSPMPANPVGFRFQGVDGRGKQQLVRSPGNGGAAVVEIEDSAGGSEGYTFDLIWGAAPADNYSRNTDQPGYPRGVDRNGGGYPDRGGRGGRHDFTADDAVQACEQNIRQQAASRFNTNAVQFRDTTLDDNPGRGDWVIGTVELRRPQQQDRAMRFSCSVDFMTGQVRSATMEPFYSRDGWSEGGRGFPAPNQGADNQRLAIQNCERGAQQRLADQGFSHVTFGEARVDLDRGQRVSGDLRAYGRYGSRSFGFSCAIDPRDGDVKSVEVSPRDEWR